ncbi:hypothetical protein NXW37_26985 [Bacteroides thetaiotaomicron]|nr:hypothetical protein [Bacteroides thetaiotaomicron]
MVRNLFLTTLCALAFCPAFAQTSTTEEKVEYSEDKYKVETNRFWSNWFISAGGGAQIYFGDHDKQVSFGKRLAPALDIAVGKWFTPGIGMRLMYSGLQQKGATQKVPCHIPPVVMFQGREETVIGWRNRNLTWPIFMPISCSTSLTCFVVTMKSVFGIAALMQVLDGPVYGNRHQQRK